MANKKVRGLEDMRVGDIAVTHRVVGSRHVYTSADVPELHVSNLDKQAAYDSIQSALDMIASMKARQATRAQVREQMQERFVG